MPDEKCGAFTSVMCGTGHCPDIPTEYDEREYSNGITCAKCWYQTYRCKDCLFQETKYCPKSEKEENS